VISSESMEYVIFGVVYVVTLLDKAEGVVLWILIRSSNGASLVAGEDNGVCRKGPCTQRITIPSFFFRFLESI
jgi:hypothetical protein